MFLDSRKENFVKAKRLGDLCHEVESIQQQ
jgi:hypothetical protein